MRETAASKAERLLLTGRVTITSVVGRRVVAAVRGDSGAIHVVRHADGAWTCSCPAGPFKLCSHRLSVMAVCAPAGALVLSPDVMVMIG